MSQFDTLPDELLSNIVEHMDSTFPEAIPNLGLTCKRLQRLCHPVQWQHVVLPWRSGKTVPIANFINMHLGNDNIKTLRLQPRPSLLRAFAMKKKTAVYHVEGLCNFLASLSKLNTFSIFPEREPNSSLPGPVLARIVRALPQSVVHLALDTGSFDKIWAEELDDKSADHLCHALSEILPRLETLHLRLSCLCPDLFRSLASTSQTQKTSRLRRAYIFLESLHPHREQEMEESLLVQGWNFHRIRDPSHKVMTTQELTRRLLDLHAAGTFPKLQRCIVYSGVIDFNRLDGYCQIRDIATRSITRFPVLHVRNALKWDIPGIKSTDLHWIYMIRSRHQENFFGTSHAIHQALLHEVAWKERGQGVRLPPVGLLKDTQLLLCPDGLLSLAYLERRLEEQRRNGTASDISELCLPSTEDCTRARVMIQQL
jgi:hypothetical protein